MAIFQTNMDGEIIKPQDPKKPWKGICCESCYNAKEEKCVCSCGGAFHGLGNVNKKKQSQDTGKPELELCPVHGATRMIDGECVECLRTESIIASETREAKAMQKSQEALESDEE